MATPNGSDPRLDDGLPPSQPASGRDPRLEIPEILRTPVKKPELLQPKANPPMLDGFGDLAKALAIGLDFLFMAAAGGVLGWLVDRWQGWSPKGLVIGLAIGFVAATVRLLQRLNREDRPKPPTTRGSPGAGQSKVG